MFDRRVVLYATGGCPRCEAARAFLQARGVEFADIEVKANPAALHELIRLVGHALVPTIVVGDDVQAGWDSARVAEMLDDPLPLGEDEVTVVFREVERELDREESGEPRTADRWPRGENVPEVEDPAG